MRLGRWLSQPALRDAGSRAGQTASLGLPFALLGLENRSVRGKLMSVMLLTTLIALLVAGIAMLATDLSIYRRGLANDLDTEAGILSLSTAPALAFDDYTAAQRNVDALEARSSVLAAAIYRVDGTRYAAFTRSGSKPAPAQLALAPAQRRIHGTIVELTHPVVRGGEFLGTIYLRGRLDLLGRVEAYAGIFALAMLLSLAVALLLSTMLQRVVTTPLEAMSAVARQVVQGDYSARAPQSADDEIGLVVQAFNRMLDEVQQRARALERSNQALQEQVREREAAERALRSSEEALRESDRRKDEFLATLAHELRNPLAPVRHAVRLLEVQGADERRQRWAREVIARQVQRMALLLDDLLDVARITRGRLQLKKDYTQLGTLVASAVETARPLIDAKGHTLELLLPAEPVSLEVDPLRISQAISNLLMNAAKYTDPGGHIALEATLLEQELRVSVKDSGIGLSSSAMPRLFEMFSQVDAAIDRAEGGLGIGLALVKGLIGMHGGSVEVASPGLGRGSTFTIHLPASALAREPRRGPESSGTAAAPRGYCRVLIADDNADAADSLGLLLEMSGHRVWVAHSGKAALELAMRERPDALILDIGMPGMTGYELARRVRQEAWGRRALLIAVTGWGQKDDKERAAAAGFDQHLTKPVSTELIERLLAAFALAHPPVKLSG
ncbi:MAG TPA: ATP-binding protein [Steroidobacteraceae bacterium]|nr:ATP-binding protein [Steroidobacteraceae bacterium]